MGYDLVIENGRIVSGTGAPWFRGTVGITDGTIEAVTRGPDHNIRADRYIDAANNIVCPGFIDTHSHSDLELFSDPTLAPKIRQGITTEILGQDGYSMAPMHAQAEEFQNQIKGLDGSVDIKDWTWDSVSEYLAAIEQNGVAPNVATLVGHGTVRYNVLGMEDRDPTEAELEEMQTLVDEALAGGAVGFSTGLVYTPAVNASTEEVAALARELRPYGRPFVAHIRSLGRWIWEAVDEFIDIGAEEDIPLLFSHIILMGSEQHGKASRLIEILESARERGVDVVADQHPYTAGSTMLLNTIPPWVKSDPDTIIPKLRDEENREEIRRDIREWRITGWENVGELCGWDNVLVSSVETQENKPLEGLSVAEIALERDDDIITTLCDLLVEEELQVSMILRSLYSEEDVEEFLKWERVMIETDGLFGGNPHPRVYGTYPRVLGHFVREENALSLEEAVRKMTSLPAQTHGLENKGLIRRDFDADIVVFDPHTIEDRTSYSHPKRYPKGISHVLVNGEFVVEDTEITGNTPGTAIKN